MSTTWPTELRLSDAGRLLTVTFDTGQSFALSAEYLRVDSPSAEVQGHGAGQKTLVMGKRNVAITRVEPVGHYAVRLVFDDGHDTGIFSWVRLFEMGSEQATCWPAYLQALDAAGHRRD